MTGMPRSSTCSVSITKQLTFNYGGRNFRLTDVYGEVIKEILV